MIRNIFVIDSTTGNSIVTANFGECHSLGNDSGMVSGFISALYSFSKSLNGETINEVRHFLIENHRDLLFVIASDSDNIEENRLKLDKIARIFYELYGTQLRVLSDHGMIPLSNFGAYLVDNGITERNCGSNPLCDDCENRDKLLPLEEMTKQVG
jgi:hypothetical protein